MDSKDFKIKICKCYILNSHKIPEIIDMIASDVERKIAGKYTDEEIEYVLDTGIYDGYGKYDALSARLFVSWFKKYSKSHKYTDLSIDNYYWVYDENKWHPTKVIKLYPNNNALYFRFLNGMHIECILNAY